MKVTTAGIVLTLKNLGAFLATYTIAGIKAEPAVFTYAILIYILINVPSDLLLANHITSSAKNEATEQLTP